MKNGIAIIVLLISVCSCLYTSGQNTSAGSVQDRRKLDSLWNVFNKEKHDTTRIKILNDKIGDLYENISTDSAIIVYKKAVSIADKALGTSTLTRGTEPDGMNSTDEVTKNLFSLKANSLRYIGLVYFNQGNYDTAIEYFSNVKNQGGIKAGQSR
jgi:tetratricopeptide (TPR) repeat protein